tara:strand:- start:4466 stop:4771 length:306 start_codon:yes stop_codon:yes gene_type:complete
MFSTNKIFPLIFLTKIIKMKNTFKMKEALNKQEAITSILDVMQENPVWLNNCNSTLSCMVQNLSPETQKTLLETTAEQFVVDLFVELKTHYYKFKDNFVWN